MQIFNNRKRESFRVSIYTVISKIIYIYNFFSKKLNSFQPKFRNDDEIDCCSSSDMSSSISGRSANAFNDAESMSSDMEGGYNFSSKSALNILVDHGTAMSHKNTKQKIGLKELKNGSDIGRRMR